MCKDEVIINDDTVLLLYSIDNVVNMVYVPHAPVGSNGAAEHDVVVRSRGPTRSRALTSHRQPPTLPSRLTNCLLCRNVSILRKCRFI